MLLSPGGETLGGKRVNLGCHHEGLALNKSSRNNADSEDLKIY